MVNRIGPYELIANLGSGAMGKVYRARDTRLDREVALKVLWPQLAEQPVAVARFEREARAVARLRHPNVVAVYDVGAADGYHYLAMEYVAGCSLRELLKQPLPVDQALHYFKQILSGLGVAHEQGVIHRDLKPGNILVESATDTVKLADFGLARIVEEEVSLTQSGEMLGTIEYMAPELGRGERASRPSDLYAAGVVLYRLLTGRCPFSGATPLAIMEAHKCGGYPLATHLVAGLPPQADGVLARLLACEPANRYADCQAVFADLERWEKGETIPLEFAAAYEPIDHELERHRVPGWQRAWGRVAAWFRYQWLEAFDRTELTAIRIRDEVQTAETELGKARRRLEEATLLRNRVRGRRDDHQVEIEGLGRQAAAFIQKHNETEARRVLEHKVAVKHRLPALEKELAAAEAAVALARREYETRAAAIAELRHGADLLLARRRRAKLERSLLGILPERRRALGARIFAIGKLSGVAAALTVAALVVVSALPAVRRGEGRLAENGRPANGVLGSGFERFLGDVPPGAERINVRAGAAPGGDGSTARPFPTIADGVAAADTGAVVLVHPGEYTETVIIDRSIWLIGAGPDRVFITPAAEQPAFTVRSSARIRGMAFVNRRRVPGMVGILLAPGAHRPEAGWCLFFNLEVGINAGDTASAPFIRHSCFYGCYMAMVATAEMRPTLANTIVYRNTFTVVRNRASFAVIPNPMGGGDPVTIVANLVYANNIDFGFFQQYGSGTIERSPQLREPTTGDFRMAAGSPLIDAGDRKYSLPGSWAGADPDIGPYEYDPSSATVAGKPDSIVGALISEVEETLVFMRDDSGTMSYRPLSTNRPGEDPERLQQVMGYPASLRTRSDLLPDTGNPLETVIAVGPPQGPWVGYTALQTDFTAWRAGPEDAGRENSTYRVNLETPTLFANSIVLTAKAGQEIRLDPRGRVQIRRPSAAFLHAGMPWLFSSRMTAGTSGVRLTTDDNPQTLVSKLARLGRSHLRFANGAAPPAAEASLTFDAAELTTEDLDRVRLLQVGDFTYQVELTRFRYALAVIQNPELLAAVPERLPFSRPDTIPYLQYLALRVRCFHQD